MEYQCLKATLHYTSIVVLVNFIGWQNGENHWPTTITKKKQQQKKKATDTKCSSAHE
jgi:hypothetical protein